MDTPTEFNRITKEIYSHIFSRFYILKIFQVKFDRGEVSVNKHMWDLP